MILSPYMTDACCSIVCLDTISATNGAQKNPNRKTTACWVKMGIFHNENSLMWCYTKPQNIFFSFFLTFIQERLDKESWMTFLEAELDSEHLESSHGTGSTEEVVLEKAKFNSEKIGRNKNLSSSFPYFQIWLSFPIQSFQSGTDGRLSIWSILICPKAL